MRLSINCNIINLNGVKRSVPMYTDEEANNSHCWRVINHEEIFSAASDDYAFEPHKKRVIMILYLSE